MTAPVTMRYEGDGEFRAVSGWWASQCDKGFVVGEVYRITEHYERSAKSHNHFFATIGDAFGSLPDYMRSEYPTAEHLRKKALIRKGYAEHRDHICTSEAAAQRLRAFIEPMDDYAIIEVREAVVRVYTAQSQSRKAMGGKAFQESKQAVLDFIDDLLGVERGATAKSSGYHVEHEHEAPAADNQNAGQNTDMPEASQASGTLADPTSLGEQSSSVSNPAQDDPQADAAATNSNASGDTTPAIPDASGDSGSVVAQPSDTVEKAAGEGYGAVSLPAAELSTEDRQWLRDGARMLLATLPSPDDPEAKQVLTRAVFGIRENTAATISVAARDKLREVAEHCMAVCKGEMGLNVPMVAKTALASIAEITPAAVKTARAK